MIHGVPTVRRGNEEKWETYLWGSDVLSRTLDTTRLLPANVIDPLIPRQLNEILQLQNPRRPPSKLIITLRPRTLDIRDQHLNVAVSAKAAFIRRLANMYSTGMAVIGLPNRSIVSRELGKDGNDARGFVLDFLLANETTITADAVDHADFGAFVKLAVEPFGHAFFPGVRTEFGFLQQDQHNLFPLGDDKSGRDICGEMEEE
jgi:hypothetical protein